MKCSKCGEQCDVNQAFCLKCGNPIQIETDFNLIEQEISNNIVEFMAEIEKEDKSVSRDADIKDSGLEEMKTIVVPADEINMELKVVDIRRKSQNIEQNIVNDLMGEKKKEGIDDSLEKTVSSKEENEVKEEIISTITKEKKRDKNSRKKIIVAIVSCVVALIAIVTVVLILTGREKEKPIKKDFNYYYSQAEQAYEENDFDNALDSALTAVNNSENETDEISGRLLVKKIYEGQKYTGEYYIRNLEELFYLGENGNDNCLVLAKYYAETSDIARLFKLYSMLDEAKIKESLGELFVEKPYANNESGEYKNRVTVELNAKEGCAIYYQISTEEIAENILSGMDETDFENFKNEMLEYVEPIELSETGVFNILTYAIDNQGMVSYLAVYEYNIVEAAADAPAITPVPGTYYEPMKIEVQVPEGGKAYYTYDGTEPDETSDVYSGPVEMQRNISTFKAIVVDQYGIVSEVASAQYNLKIPRNETIESGKDKVWQYYFNSGLIDTNGNQADGSVIEVSYYDAVNIDNNEYYIYQVIATAEEGTLTTGITFCAVNTYDGKVTAGIIYEGDEFILSEEDM